VLPTVAHRDREVVALDAQGQVHGHFCSCFFCQFNFFFFKTAVAVALVK